VNEKGRRLINFFWHVAEFNTINHFFKNKKKINIATPQRGPRTQQDGARRLYQAAASQLADYVPTTQAVFGPKIK
jgi:hypothetical protein